MRSIFPSVCRGLLCEAPWLVWLVAGVFSPAQAQEPRLELRPGERIAVIGNTLAERLQHDGWLETLVQARHPRHQLVWRDLGFAGDELTLRLRSLNFGSPDQWLTQTRADVVLAFFGYNESFAGPEGLDRFRKELDDFIKHTRSQKYNAGRPARLVLFSPIAHEDLKDPNLPDGKENNRRLKLYTAAMAEVARVNQVPFVDLFQPTLEMYARSPQPLTSNGIHLNEAGNEQLAEVITRALWPDQKPRLDTETIDRLRQAVLDKNFHWFHRYRTADGYSIYGGRADLRFVGGQTNREVMRREMEVLDQMTANRDRRIWALAQGRDLAVDDSNTPPFIPVQTNKPGAGPGGAHLFLDGQAAIGKMTVAKGMQVQLFASEKEFPVLANPVQMAFDTKGRLWVVAWPSYPHWKPKEEMNDKLLILEDTDGDGKADKVTVFADRLHCPTGFEFHDGGVLVACAPDVWFLRDTNGDDRADVRTRVLSGIDSADTHCSFSNFVFDPGGALYMQEGTFHHTQVETPWGPPVRCANAGVFRFEPRTRKFEVFIAHNFANVHAHVIDRWGQGFVIDGTGAQTYHTTLFSGRIDYPQKHPRPPQVYPPRTRPCPSAEILSSRHFPPESQGNLLVANVIGFQGILQYRLGDQGSSFTGTEVEPIVFSSDPNFRPADIKMGPDGAIWFCDWHNPIIGHMQHNLRDPSRDRTHGRVYRVTCTGRPLVRPVPIAGEPIERLLDLLREPDDRVRYRARLELGSRPTAPVLAAAGKWVANLDRQDLEHEHHLLEALWLHQSHNVVNDTLLTRLLESPDFRARAAAVRVLCCWRDRVPDTLERLNKRAADPHARVRLEAVRAASFFTCPEAIEVPLIVAEQPGDPYLDWTRTETMKVLEPGLRKAIAEGKPLPFLSGARARVILKSVGTDDLLKMKRTEGVLRELLGRGSIADEVRREALADLARLSNRTELACLLDAVRSREATDESVLLNLMRMLASRDARELIGVRSELERLATTSKPAAARELGFVTLIVADGGADKAWELAAKSASSLRDLLHAVPLIRDPGVRASLYPRVEPLLRELPRHLMGSAAKGMTGRYVRVELLGPGRILTLAEVEVFSDGRNVARQGKATQKNTGFGGLAERAIDGNKSGRFADGGQSTTQENTPDPWWEVDLGAEFAIDAIVVFNRTEGSFAQRLDRFALLVLDERRSVVYRKDNQPAPAAQVRFDIEGSQPEGMIRRAAILALPSVRGQEEKTVTTLARLVHAGIDRPTAIRALSLIPPSRWPAAEARPLLDRLVGSLRQVPPQDRTSAPAQDMLRLADALASFLPIDEARKVRKELGDLTVRVVRLATVPEQMIYDQERFAVKAGKPVEVHFENTDLMPHNLVILQPGSLEEIGQLAEVLATTPGAAERHYVPGSPKVLASSRLLQPREVQQLRFTAPARAGVYPYVCTYPGHWRRMFGAMYVVEDLDEYLADAETYLTRHPLPIADPLLKQNRPRKEWKQADLAENVEQMHHGRSFANGKLMFQVASCTACHRLNGVGAEFAPDLTKLDPKLKPVDILLHILEPSREINEKYRSYLLETRAGRVLTAVILEETAESLKVIENPLARAEPVVLKKGELVDRQKLLVSLMPKGLLDRLTREEVLDLLAYVVGRGDPRHPLFQGSHAHPH